MTILAYICTCNRYESTLPLAILSIINQTHKIDKFVIFDDSREPKDIRSMEHYLWLLKLLDQKSIPWVVIYGERKGVHFSHEKANMMGFDLCWNLDDDEVAEPHCLEELVKEMKGDVGAVGGLVSAPLAGPLPPNADNKISNLFLPNIQWFQWEGESRPVEHLYSSYLYRANIVHWDLRLSNVAFRSETMFSHALLLKGYKLIVTPKAITWHLQSKGGIHDGQQMENWRSDEAIFQNWLGFTKSEDFLVVLDNGMGDHVVFKKAVLPKLKARHKNIVIACCYPALFPDEKTISIAEAQRMVDIEKYNIYAIGVNSNWGGNIASLYEKVYGLR